MTTQVTINSYGIRVEAVREPLQRPEPQVFGGTEEKPLAAFLEKIKCCHGYATCLQGQRICFECGGPVRPGQLKAQGRRTYSHAVVRHFCKNLARLQLEGVEGVPTPVARARRKMSPAEAGV